MVDETMVAEGVGMDESQRKELREFRTDEVPEDVRPRSAQEETLVRMLYALYDVQDLLHTFKGDLWLDAMRILHAPEGSVWVWVVRASGTDIEPFTPEGLRKQRIPMQFRPSARAQSEAFLVKVRRGNGSVLAISRAEFHELMETPPEPDTDAACSDFFKLADRGRV